MISWAGAVQMGSGTDEVVCPTCLLSCWSSSGTWWSGQFRPSSTSWWRTLFPDTVPPKQQKTEHPARTAFPLTVLWWTDGQMDLLSFGRTPWSRRWCRHTPEHSPGQWCRWRRTQQKLCGGKCTRRALMCKSQPRKWVRCRFRSISVPF